jgi:site-specific recombinase XerD
MLAQAEKITAIPTKRVPPPETFYLEKDEVDTLFGRLPTKGRFALRDRTLFLFLYNTGARVQEVADLRVSNLVLEPQPRVYLHGKGDKWRVCPLWQETASLLKQLLYQGKTVNMPDRPVFMSHTGRALTRYGIYKIVRRHTQHLGNKNSGARCPNVSPHVFRHTTAVHLLEAGVEVNVIRAWLGHVSLETTNRYAEINIRMKEEALRHCHPPILESERFLGKRIWRDDPELLEWLESL